jgi:hypothetical protein
MMGACSRELAMCPDGTPVGRSGPNCHFEACSGGVCPIGTYTCDDGTELDRDSTLGCEFPKCPESIPLQDSLVSCTEEAKICPDGTSVGRTGPKCEFEPCPVEALVACTLELKTCPDGTSVGRTGPNCEFEPCPEEALAACTLELKACPDGTSVGRTGPNCEFDPCP